MRRKFPRCYRITGRLLSSAIDRQFGAGLYKGVSRPESVAGWHAGARRGAVFQVVGRSVIEMLKSSSTSIATAGATASASSPARLIRVARFAEVGSSWAGTQAELANRADVTQSDISQIQNRRLGAGWPSRTHACWRRRSLTASSWRTVQSSDATPPCRTLRREHLGGRRRSTNCAVFALLNEAGTDHIGALHGLTAPPELAWCADDEPEHRAGRPSLDLPNAVR